jgi:uncharacterized protein (UPF0333 family)
MNNKGQQVTEYALIVGIVVLALAAMTPLFKRGLQGIIKMTDDQAGANATAEYRAMYDREVPAQVIGQMQEGMYGYTTTPARSSSAQRTNETSDTKNRSTVIDEESTYTGQYNARYRFFTNDVP